MLIRFSINGQPVKPKGAVGGTATGNDVWLAKVKFADLLTAAPLTLGASTPVAEHASCVIDEFSLFARALIERRGRKALRGSRRPDGFVAVSPKNPSR